MQSHTKQCSSADRTQWREEHPCSAQQHLELPFSLHCLCYRAAHHYLLCCLR
ncbi:unnamed protein product, partial [Staurois parvus]